MKVKWLGTSCSVIWEVSAPRGTFLNTSMTQFWPVKNASAFETPHVAVFLAVVLVNRFLGIILQHTFHRDGHGNVFWPCDLDLWPMTLTYKLDLDILPLDLHAKFQVRMSVRLAVRVVTDTQTDTHTHRRCQNYYTRHVTDVGCKNMFCNFFCKIHNAYIGITKKTQQ